MRIISQDGTIDVPYEQVSIERKNNEIWCGYSSTMQQYCVGKCFAKYSKESDAKKAIEILRDAYAANEIFKIMSVTQKAALATIANIKQQEQLGGIFRFPKDNEIV